MKAKFLISAMILTLGLGAGCRQASFKNIDKSGPEGAGSEDGIGGNGGAGDGIPGTGDSTPNLDPSNNPLEGTGDPNDPNKPIDPTQGNVDPVDPVGGKDGKISLTVTLSQPSVKMGENKVQATAKLNTTSVPPMVRWSLSGPTDQMNLGSIDASGVYTSPKIIDKSFPISVIATLIADPRITGMAPLLVEPLVNPNPNRPILTVTTPVDTVKAGELKVPATAKLNTQSTPPNVVWSIIPPTGVSDPGTIDQSGVYTSPKNTPSPFPITIVATLKADPTVQGIKAIIVEPVGMKPTLTVTTPSPEIKAGEEKMQATAILSSTPNKPDVFWTVMGPVGKTEIGSIDSNGVYTSPKSTDKEFPVVITATLKADTSISGAVTIRVIPKDVIFARCTKGSVVFPIVADVYRIPVNSPKLPNFADASQAQKVTTVCMDKYAVAPRNFTAGFPDVPGVFEWFALNTKTQLIAPVDGYYTFFLNSDDGSKLYVDGVLRIDHDGQHQAYGTGPGDSTDVKLEKFATFFLRAGVHDVRLDYFQGPRERIALELKWMIPDSNHKVYVPRENFK